MPGLLGPPEKQQRTPLRGLLAENVGQTPQIPAGLLEVLVGMLPGAGDVMAAQQSQQAGQRMADALRGGDFGRAASSGLAALGLGLGALPMIPALGGVVGKIARGRRNVVDLPLPSWARTAEADSVEIIQNPSRTDVGKLIKKHGTARAMRNPETGELFVWDANVGLHVDAATHLDLPFKNRRELQENSFIIHDLSEFDRLIGQQ